MFSKPTQVWFDATFAGPTDVQRRGWEAIGRGDHALLVAPTGSGKTLAAFLAGIDALVQREPPSQKGTRVLYVSPLKALVYDIERNLRVPLAGIGRTAEQLGLALPPISVAVRTGDTPARERQRQLTEPGDILVTTPESLFLLLGSRARETLRQVKTVIVDEVHALAPSKRGTHLAISLERLSDITAKDPQRIGLSATVRPIDEIARFLGGSRPVEVVDASAPPRLDLRVTVPVPDMTQVPLAAAQPPGPRSASGPEPDDRPIYTPPGERGIWPAIYPQLLEEVRGHQSTIIFTNSRGLCERLAQRLNDLAGEELVRAHHGSVSHEKRAEIEEGLKAGMIRGIVATSSLELGIDMGAVDRVICVESPGSVARGLQRVGRAGHQVGEISVGRIYPKFRGDLLESAVIAQRMRSAELESTSIPQNPLDVLAQQIVAMCCDTSRTVDEIEALVTRAYPFRNLSRGVLESVLDMVSGRYPSSEFADLRPWLRWDRATDVLSARRGAVMVSRMNPGTIPDRGHYAVHLGADGPRIGELDEEMVFESREGDVFLLGATSWRVEEITRDRVVVTPAPGEPGRLPFWKGEGPGRPVELGRAIGVFLQELGRVGEARAAQWLQSHTPLDPFAARNLAAYVFEQQAHAGCLPTDRTLCVERFRDELGDWRVCILTPFGARLHAPWAMALQRILSLRGGYETQLMYAEDGIVLRFADTDELPGLDVLIPDPDEIEDLITDQLPDTALFAGLFRENAARSLLLPRRRLTQRNPLWAQRLKSQALLASVRQYPSFPIVLETFRQALRDVFDLPALRQLLRDVRMRNVHVHQVETTSASPFARSLVFSYVAAYMYEQDAPLAERRAQALTLDRQLLGELLGQAELRELIDAGVLAELESELQHLPQDRKARDEDEVHDLLRRLGDLSEAEIRDRTVTDPGAWLRSLQRQRRVAAIEVAGESRWIAAEDAALFRDSLGVLPGADLPTAFLEPVENALLQLVRRHARHRGPFLAGDLTRRYGLSLAQIASSLRELERIGALVHGEVRPGGTELDWCDAEVLRQLKRRTLARLRNEVAPVDARTLGVFLPQWHGIGLADRRPDRLVESIAQLEGVALPWSEWNDTILPSRVLGFRPQMLDMLSATGEVVWVGRSPLGPKDGRVVLLLREHVGELLDRPPEGEALGEVQAAILTHLRQRGASFATEIESAVRQERSRLRTDEFTQAIWDLVWQGIVTNDTFGPLHALRAPQRAMRRSARGHALAGGRWSLVADLVSAEISPTQRALALSRLLLQRYGVVSREAAQAEELAGGFSAVYKVLRTMEEHGGIRRGYFVEGLTGAQFAHAGAVDLLRAGRPDPDGDETLGPGHVCVLPAVDPANPYGSLVAWPARTAEDAPPPRRMPGSWVVLVAGHPALYVGPRGRHLLTFPFPGRPLQDVLPLAVSAWLQAPHRHGRPILEKVDGQSVLDSPHLDVLRRCGFERGYRGLIRAGG